MHPFQYSAEVFYWVAEHLRGHPTAPPPGLDPDDLASILERSERAQLVALWVPSVADCRSRDELQRRLAGLNLSTWAKFDVIVPTYGQLASDRESLESVIREQREQLAHALTRLPSSHFVALSTGNSFEALPLKEAACDSGLRLIPPALERGMTLRSAVALARTGQRPMREYRSADLVKWWDRAKAEGARVSEVQQIGAYLAERDKKQREADLRATIWASMELLIKLVRMKPDLPIERPQPTEASISVEIRNQVRDAETH